MTFITTQLKTQGMHCSGCEQTIEDTVHSLPGINKVKASYAEEVTTIEFDDELITKLGIEKVIEAKGYSIQKTDLKPNRRFFSLLIFILLLLAVGAVVLWGKSLMPDLLPQLNAQMSYIMLFGIGFLTGFHCIGMCGSFVMSYSSQKMSANKNLLSHLFYGIGKTASYCLIGAAFGLFGAVITITPHMRGVAALAASVFLLLYGLKMLNLIPGLRNFTLRLPKAITRNIGINILKHKNPLVIGLFSGLLLGCGPLQAMYIMAAGTGSPQQGATLLFFFGLGTLVPLLGFGFFANLMSRNSIHEMVRVSGVLVMIMGVMMADRGLKMTQSGYDLTSLWGQLKQVINLI